MDLRGGVLADAASSGRACRVAGLIWGKTFWIELVTLLAHRTRVATLSSGVSTAPVWGVAALAGSGFTVLMFITGLASTTPGSSTMPR